MNQPIPAEAVRIVVGLGALAAFVGLNGMLMVYVERKVAGFIQKRPGPYEVGPYGLLQAVADAVKLIAKQIAAPAGADRFLFIAAPVLSFLPVMVAFLPMPFSDTLTGLSSPLSLVLVLAVIGLGTVALCLAGLASANTYGVLGSSRAIAQAVAYEIPLLLAVLAICIQAGSLDMAVIVKQQGSWPWAWNVVVQPVAFLIFLISSVAENNRAPFDIPEAESELTAGFHTEYSGMGFGLFFLAEYAAMIISACLMTVLFLGGDKGPFVDGVWWFLAKVYVLLVFVVWIRWTYPRLRFDQLLNLCWRWLTPAALVNLLLTVVAVALWGGRP